MPLDDLPWAVASVLARSPYYSHHRNYYEGRHRLAFATDRFRSTFGALFEDFRDNLCPAPVNAMVDRLQISAWTAAAGADSSAAATAATTVWEANRDGRQGQVHLTAARDGDGFLLVWPGTDAQPRFWPQDPTAMAVRYDDEDDPERIVTAAKLWKRPDRRWRLNLYTDGLVERWVTREATDDTSALHKPGKWVDWNEDEWGPAFTHEWAVPVFHFPNNAAVGQVGLSELHDVVPVQDALNKTLADLLVSGEFVALPQRVLIGVEREIDPLTGLERRLEPGADRVWRVSNPNASVEEFQAANLTQFTTVADAFRLEIARITGTPLGDMNLQTSTANLSGEALGHLESRMVKKCHDRMREWGPVWRAAMATALAMAGSDPGPKLELRWDDPASEDPTGDLQRALLKKQLGWSNKALQRELGLEDAQIAAMADELSAEQGAMANAMLAQFDRGAGATLPGGLA